MERHPTVMCDQTDDQYAFSSGVALTSSSPVSSTQIRLQLHIPLHFFEPISLAGYCVQVI